MDHIDEQVQQALTTAAGSPVMTERDALLAALTARIDRGGADVAEAPPAPTPLEPVGEPASDLAAGTVPVGSARRAARAASIGVGGWLALAAGAAATAAASSWLIDRAASEPAPVPSIEAPLIEDVRAQAAPGIEAVIPHITAPEGSDAASWTPGGGAPAPDRTPVQVTPRDSADGSRSSGETGPRGETAPGQQSPGGAAPGTAPPALGDVEVQVPLGELEDAVKDTVDGVLPDGPLQDTVAPVIHAVDVSGLASWVVDSLLCGAQAPVSVQASDNAGVTEASLRVTTATGHTQRIALGDGGGGLWSGALAPITGLQLGLLDPLVEVRVEVRDAAGNVATTHREVSVGIGSCLLG